MRNFRKQADRRNDLSRRVVAQAVQCIEGLESRTLFAATITPVVQINPAPSPNPYAANSLPGVTLSVQVFDPNSGQSPTGSVQFQVGSTLIGSPVVLSGGSATETGVTTLPVGNDSITAHYLGDATYIATVSPAVSETVTGSGTTTIGTTTTLSSNVNNVVVGTNVTFTANIAPATTGGAAVTGTVTFTVDGTAVVPASTVNGSGAATFSTSTLTAGIHTIAATYSGDANYDPSSSPNFSETIVAAGLTPTTTTVSTLTPTIVVGNSVTFTATINQTAATGTVQFYSNGTAIGAAQAINNGIATLATSALATGSDSITAIYSGDSTFATSQSAPIIETVNPAVLTATTTAVSTLTPTITVGSSVTFTATVTPGAATGTVQFFSNGTAIGIPQTLSGGTASLTTSALTVGSDTITAHYLGDSTYAASNSPGITETVNAASLTPTTTTVSTLTPTITSGASVTFTATINNIAATGTVQFFSNGVTLGTPQTVSGGTASLTTSALVAVSTDSITAVYSGDSTFQGSTSPAFTETVNAAVSPTTTTLVALPTNTTVGNAVMLTATVSPGTATGTIQFLDGSTVLGTRTLSGGTASLSVSSFIVGMHSITASYSGDSVDSASASGAVVVNVGQGTPVLTVSTSAATIALGQTATLTATVAPAVPGGPLPTGTVNFMDGGANLGGPVTLSGGVATFVVSGLTVGSHSISFSYSGDTQYLAGNANPITETVNVAATTVTLVPTPNPVVFGNPISITATLNQSAATGTVTFFDGSTSLGTAPVFGGSATINGIFLNAGTSSLTAVYSGDGNYSPGTSPAVIERITRAASTTTVTASVSTIVYGNVLVLTANVSPSVATGTVTFFSNGVTLGTATVVGGGIAAIPTGALLVGTDNITARYNGDTNYSPSSSAASPVTVTQGLSVTTLTASPATVAYGAPVTLTVSVASAITGLATPTGTVTLVADGIVTLATNVTLVNGTASFTTNSLPLGTDTIIATYNGDSNYLTSASPGTPARVTAVTNSTSTVQLDTTTPTLAFGDAVTFTATVASAITSTTVPTGSVTFLFGTQALGAPVTLVNGIAFLTTTSLPPGTDAITAVYSGDASFTGSTSAPVIETVTGNANGGVFVTSLTSSATNAAFGDPVTLTSNVFPATPGANNAIGGTVTFFANGQAIGAAALAGDDSATFSTTLPAGIDRVTAAYNGGNKPITSSLPVTVAVGSPATPSFSKATLPPAIIVGTSFHTSLPLVITNLGDSRLKGPFQIDVYVDASPTFDGRQVLLSHGVRNYVLNGHKFKIFRTAETLQPDLPSGTYYLLADVTDPNGLTNLQASAPIVVAPPFVALAASVSATNPPNIGIGQSATVWVTINNNGNEAVSGLLDLTLSPASDTTKILGTLSQTTNIPAGKSRRFLVTLDTTSLATGSYQPYVSLSLDGISTTAVGVTPFTVGTLVT